MTIHADHCAEWRALASCRLDGELDELEAARLDRHLLVCPACDSWAREVAALAGLLHASEPLRPVSPFELRTGTLRRRFARTAMVGATAASAAAVAAFAFSLPSSTISPFSSNAPNPPAGAPCISCTKKQALTQQAAFPPASVAPIHVENPLLEEH